MEAAAATKKAPFVTRYFWKCSDCLSVFATVERPGALRCGICSGAAEYMGHTVRGWINLAQVHHLCPCDARCTNAPGPNCSCRCGGENHGSGLVVAVVVSTGIAATEPRQDPKAMQRATEYRAALEATRAALDWARRLDEQKRKRYLEASEYNQWWRGRRAFEAFAKAKAVRTHAARLKALANVRQEYGQ